MFSSVLINYFILPLLIATVVQCPIYVAALKTLLKNSCSFYRRLAGAMRLSVTSYLDAQAFCSFCKGNADLELSFRLKFAFFLSSKSGVLETSKSMSRSASKHKQAEQGAGLSRH